MKPIKTKWEALKTSIGLSPFHYLPVNIVKDDTTTLPYVVSLVEQGLIRPCVDKTFDLENIKKAHAYVEKGHTKGKVVLRVVFPEQGSTTSDHVDRKISPVEAV
jgi:hypothetical protein